MEQHNQHTLAMESAFDPRSCRHLVEGQSYVMHCHHYATLYTQLAEDCGMLDGKKLLAETAEDTFYEVLSAYFEKYNVKTVAERLSAGEQYFRTTGMGVLKVANAGADGGNVELPSSHLDAGWIKKWGKTEQACQSSDPGIHCCAVCRCVWQAEAVVCRAGNGQHRFGGAPILFLGCSRVKGITTWPSIAGK